MKIQPDRRLFIPIISLCLFANSNVLLAQAQSGASKDHRGVRVEGSLGLHNSGSFSRLDPAAGGKFRDTGIGIGGAAHWVMREGNRSDLLFGFDTYISSNESSVRTSYDDVLVSGFQLTPSVKFSFDNGSGPRYLFGVGVGYYEVEIEEVKTFWFGERSEHSLWRDSSIGGYIGLDIDFPRRNFDRQHGFFFSTRINFVDHGTVREEGSPRQGVQTLGLNAGSLSDPTIALHFGYQLFR